MAAASFPTTAIAWPSPGHRPRLATTLPTTFRTTRLTTALSRPQAGSSALGIKIFDKKAARYVTKDFENTSSPDEEAE